MSIEQQAALVIWDAQAAGTVKPRDLAAELNEAGLLAPELPEANDPTADFVPDGKGWLLIDDEGPVVWTAPGGSIMIQRVEPGGMSPDVAREFAHQILAAVEHAESEEA